MFVGKIGVNFVTGEPTLAKAAAVGEIPGSDPSAVVVWAAPMCCDHDKIVWEYIYIYEFQRLMHGSSSPWVARKNRLTT